jgi:hypothetical protein
MQCLRDVHNRCEGKAAHPVVWCIIASRLRRRRGGARRGCRPVHDHVSAACYAGLGGGQVLSVAEQVDRQGPRDCAGRI